LIILAILLNKKIDSQDLIENNKRKKWTKKNNKSYLKGEEIKAPQRTTITPP
jgi:hypothetical protein